MAESLLRTNVVRHHFPSSNWESVGTGCETICGVAHDTRLEDFWYRAIYVEASAGDIDGTTAQTEVEIRWNHGNNVLVLMNIGAGAFFMFRDGAISTPSKQ